jgi:hypothetical protein
MTDFIKRVQSRLSSKNLKLSRAEISAKLIELEILENEINDSNIENITLKILNNAQTHDNLTIALKSSETLTTTESSKNELFDPKIGKNNNLNIVESDNLNIVKNNNLNIVESDNLNIVERNTLTLAEKESLVLDVATQLNIVLIGDEIKEIAKSISSEFISRDSMLKTISSALISYTEHITQQHDNLIAETVNTVKQRLNNSSLKTKNQFTNLSSELKASNTDFKSFEQDINMLFAVP